MPSVAVVLGGGGIVGAAWTVGILERLAEQSGFDARHADLLVGTSAGATVAAALRLGLSPAEHAQGAGSGEWLLPDAPSHRIPWLPQSPRLIAAGLWRIGEPRLGLSLAGVVPTGTIDTAVVGDPIRARADQLGRPWPDAPTWVCAVGLDDGRRAVMGRDARPDADLATAVEASCAVPGYFRPVDIDGTRYIDGGSHSTTNADVVAGLGFDLVVVVSPLTAVASLVRPGTRRVLRAYRSRQLAQEVALLARTRTRTFVVQPTADDLEALEGDPLDGARASAVLEAGRATMATRLDRPDASATMALLERATSQRS